MLLVGTSGAGKSTFARTKFRPHETLSSDFFRGMVRNDETDMGASADAFDVLRSVLRKRLAAGLLTVVDATNVRPEERKPLIAIAKTFHATPVAIVLDVPLETAITRNDARGDRPNSRSYVTQQRAHLDRSRDRLGREGLRHVYVLRGEDEITAATIRRVASPSDRRDECGPFDIVGDVHGCLGELTRLLTKLGYDAANGFRPPAGRRLVFLGDLVDRGPSSVGCLRLAMAMVERGDAICLPGNHDVKLARWLRGENVRIGHGLERTIAEMQSVDASERLRFATFIDGLVPHVVLDEGRLVVAHAGLKQEMQLRITGAVRAFALYGDTTGEVDELGLPVRRDWAADYHGAAAVVYGHTPTHEALWVNETICIDTGCVFGGALTALRWPERELVREPAAETYFTAEKSIA